jgi:peptidoglycan/LPS O-acetylase OafA/YrhL
VGGKAREYARPDTGFRWLRLLGAFIVIINHSPGLAVDPWATVLPEEWQISPGHITLMAFFAMSGYQVSGSWQRDPSWWRFAARRVLRIMPPLLLTLMITAFIIGPLFTNLSAGDYWDSSRTFRYVVFGAGLFPIQYDLPGVFAGSISQVVNGSIWTLPMEVLGYGLVLLIGVIVALGVTRMVVFALLAAMVFLDISAEGVEGGFGAVPIEPTVSLLVAFVIGMILYACRDRIPLRPLAAFALVAMWLALHWTPLDRYVLPVMAGYGVIVWAHHLPKRFESGKRWAYGSYGVYLWGFPVQQMIVAVTGVGNHWVLSLLACPVAYLAGLLSWRYIEEPTQQLRSYIRRPRPVVRAAPVVVTEVGLP